jgi:hypothetical protein
MTNVLKNLNEISELPQIPGLDPQDEIFETSEYRIGVAHVKVLESIIEKQNRENENLSSRVFTLQTASEQSDLIMKALGGIAILVFFLGIYVGEHL